MRHPFKVSWRSKVTPIWWQVLQTTHLEWPCCSLELSRLPLWSWIDTSNRNLLQGPQRLIQSMIKKHPYSYLQCFANGTLGGLSWDPGASKIGMLLQAPPWPLQSGPMSVTHLAWAPGSYTHVAARDTYILGGKPHSASAATLFFEPREAVTQYLTVSKDYPWAWGAHEKWSANPIPGCSKNYTIIPVWARVWHLTTPPKPKSGQLGGGTHPGYMGTTTKWETLRSGNHPNLARNLTCSEIPSSNIPVTYTGYHLCPAKH